MENSVQNTISQQLYDMMVSRDLQPEALDAMGKETDPSDASLISFTYETENKNYGTVVVSLGNDNSLEVFYSDNLGRNMLANDREGWYDFLLLLRNIAKRNMLTFSLSNMNKLKYSMRSMAASVNESKYFGTSRTSYTEQSNKTRLIIKHNKKIGEDDARFRNVDSLFIESDAGERFKLPFTNISGGKAMARHVSEGGNPYDDFGKHICEMISDIATLGKFARATRTADLAEETLGLVNSTVDHYKALKRKVKQIISKRGYREAVQSFIPPLNAEVDTSRVREMFMQGRLDPRIEEALGIVARIHESTMSEVNEFANWVDSVDVSRDHGLNEANNISELEDLLREPLSVGPDASNAIAVLADYFDTDDELFDDLRELASSDPDADARSIIMDRLAEMGVDISIPTEETLDIDTGKQVVAAQKDPMLEDDDLSRIIKFIRSK